MKNIISVKSLTKKYKNFTLGSIDLDIPCGFSTALIGSNGAGKTTLLDTICGLSGKYSGNVNFFEKYNNPDDPYVRLKTGYCPSGFMYPLNWTVKRAEKMTETAFENFDKNKFESLCSKMQLKNEKNKKIIYMSDGTRMKLFLAAVMARDTNVLILDEPGSALDPLMRDRLCGLFREYLAEKDGERSVIFSTHNIADMESAADYAVIMAAGKIIECGFTEDLKEKYCIVNGSAENAEKAKPYMITFSQNSTIYEGLALRKYAYELEQADAAVERPSLQQISVELLRKAEQEDAK